MLMTMESSLDFFLARLGEAGSREEAWDATVEHFSGAGFDGVVCLTCFPRLADGGRVARRVLGSVASSVLHAFGDDAIDLADPIMTEMAQAFRPFFRLTEGTAADLAASPLASAAQTAGYGGLLLIPARCGSFRCAGGVILFSRRDGAWLREHATQRGLDLAHAGVQAYLRIRQLLERDDQGQPLLTNREREVLTLSARGLTTRDVGAALGISISGVNFHIANASRKLGANNRTHATSLALSLGLIRV
ncbi:helix-turn-helix transcriptional regulator [uncultured Rhodospira sp.]|uniref:helix-turn-helix transcriptional regulator n=1 Tax=uncultured Rhodospira sp. TaxID=1936189 RepID=UPI00260E61A2|nr:helix-turn-helix transcriptional regulator [uncultured Rhodospira sp.]